jgi:hypothetical protein
VHYSQLGAVDETQGEAPDIAVVADQPPPPPGHVNTDAGEAW